jgi:hypothetical protein
MNYRRKDYGRKYCIKEENTRTVSEWKIERRLPNTSNIPVT